MTVMVVDEVFDPEALGSAVSRSALELPSGQPGVSWEDQNRGARDYWETGLQPVLRDYYNDLKVRLASADPSVRELAQQHKATLKALPNFFSVSNHHSHLNHGTAVAAKAIEGEGDFSLALGVWTRRDPLAPRAQTIEALAQRVEGGLRKERDLAAVSRTLEAERTRIAVFSFSITPEMIAADVEAEAVPELIASEPEGIQLLSLRARERASRAIEALFDRHPDTSFVLSAGNDALDLDQRCDDLINAAAAARRNTLVVAATAGQVLAPFSNQGELRVDLAAQGVDVPTTAYGGAPLCLDGTSLSAPVAARALADVRRERPELDGAGAIEELRATRTVSLPELVGKVRDARVLLPPDGQPQAKTAASGVPLGQVRLQIAAR
jgi:hypothetical protein